MPDSRNAIEVVDGRKKFRVYFDKGSTLKEKILRMGSSRYESRDVLKGISFSIKKGEAVGLVGQNGCGKSTTLKLLTRIIYPDAGTIEMSGRVSSLLELGAGFHPDMSGRENVYINASIFGLGRREIDQRMGEIIRFSELEDYIDNPVRTYSSGMYMRLAFSVAIHVDADILLIDEILAVGDVSFQAKCFKRLMEIKQNGTTIVLVSHSTDQIERLCERSIWIQDGLIRMDGSPQKVHEHYLNYMNAVHGKAGADDLNQILVRSNSTNRLKSLLYIDSGNGYSEEDTLSAEAVIEDGRFRVAFELDSDRKIMRLRFDPEEGRICRCRIEESFADGQAVKAYPVNSLGVEASLFLNLDPQIEILLKPGNYHKLELAGIFEYLNEDYIEQSICRIMEERVQVNEKNLFLLSEIDRLNQEIEKLSSMLERKQ